MLAKFSCSRFSMTIFFPQWEIRFCASLKLSWNSWYQFILWILQSARLVQIGTSFKMPNILKSLVTSATSDFSYPSTPTSRFRYSLKSYYRSHKHLGYLIYRQNRADFKLITLNEAATEDWCRFDFYQWLWWYRRRIPIPNTKQIIMGNVFSFIHVI